MAARKPAAKKPQPVVETTAPAATKPPMSEAQMAATVLYNKAYEAFVRMAADAHKISGEDLVLAHAVARLRVQAAIKTGAIVCPRCNGTKVTTFAEIEGGRCFRCTDAPAKEVAAAKAA